jgi:hypothetical protein
MPDARPDLERAGFFPLGSWQVNRIGYIAQMQQAGDGVFGPRVIVTKRSACSGQLPMAGSITSIPRGTTANAS